MYLTRSLPLIPHSEQQHQPQTFDRFHARISELLHDRVVRVDPISPEGTARGCHQSAGDERKKNGVTKNRGKQCLTHTRLLVRPARQS